MSAGNFLVDLNRARAQANEPFAGPFRVRRFVCRIYLSSPFGVVHPLGAREFEFVMAEDWTTKDHSVVTAIDGEKDEIDVSNAFVEDSAGIVICRSLSGRIGQNVGDKRKGSSGISVKGVPLSRAIAGRLVVPFTIAIKQTRVPSGVFFFADVGVHLFYPIAQEVKVIGVEWLLAQFFVTKKLEFPGRVAEALEKLNLV